MTPYAYERRCVEPRLGGNGAAKLLGISRWCIAAQSRVGAKEREHRAQTGFEERELLGAIFAGKENEVPQSEQLPHCFAFQL